MDQLGDHTINLKTWTAAAPDAPPVHVLIVLRDGAPATRLPLDALPLTIGRSVPADLVLNDIAVSRRHCRLDCVAERVVLTDLGSTNGTYVAGALVNRPVALEDGAMIRIGAHTLRYYRRSRDEAEEAAALERDLQDASEYVAAILPPPIDSGPVLASSLFQPSARLSGDAFGFRWLDERWFAVFLLDVAGHGAAAALHAVTVANVLRQPTLPDVDFRDPGSVLRCLNRMFPMESHNERFFTIWYGVYDRLERSLRYASGGHHPGYLVVPGTSPQPLATRNPAIGMALDRPITSSCAEIPPGSTLHLFSDSAFEAVDASGREIGLPTVVELLPQMSTPRRLHDAVRARVRPGPLEDDFSSIVLRFP